MTTNHLRRENVSRITALRPGVTGTEVIRWVCPEGTGSWAVVKSVRYGVVRINAYGYVHMTLNTAYDTAQEAVGVALECHYEYRAIVKGAVR